MWHSVEITEFYCHHFVVKIPSKRLFSKELYTELIWRKIFCMAVNFSFFLTALCVAKKFYETRSRKKKNFVKSTYLLKSWFHGKMLIAFHTALRNCGFSSEKTFMKSPINSKLVSRNCTLNQITLILNINYGLWFFQV